MLAIIQQNRWFFSLYLLFIILGGFSLIFVEHGEAIFFFSDRRSMIGDFFFLYWTKMGEELLYIISIVILCFIRFRYALIIPLIGLIVTIISNITKGFFGQPRPGLYFKEEGLIETLNLIEGVILHTGATSFPSGHTMSGFALYGFIAFCVPRKKWLAVFLFTTALLVGISRIYLVQHFLRDVYLGGIIGVLIAWVIFYIQSFIPYQKERWYDQSFLSKREQKRLELERQKINNEELNTKNP